MIKNKIKISLLIAVFSLALFGGVNYANAQNLTFTDDTIVEVGGISYIIKADSEANQIDVGATTLIADVPAGSSFTLASPIGYDLGDDQGIVGVCTGYERSETYTPDPGGIVTFTPTTVKVCGSPGNSGSGTTDTTAPTNTSVSISAGATTTASTSVTLTLAATGASHMMIANDSAFTGASWETYATSKAWVLTTGDGVKTVYAKFKDTAGNISTAVSDTITLEAVAVTTLPAGCTTGDLFSATTGLSCAVATTTLPAGCTTGDLFSATTGLSCAVATTTTTTLPEGCTTGDLFSATTGLSCGVTTVVPVVVPGCSTGDLFSATSGASCGTTTTTTPAGATETPTASATPSVSSANLTAVQAITVNLYYGMTGKADVKTLQQFLVDQNKGPKAEALGAHGTTTNFGPMTKAALAEWQSVMDISPAAGYFGPITRSVIAGL